MKLNLVPESFVVDLIILTATGEGSESINKDVFEKAVELMRESEISDFEDVTFHLKEHGCDATEIFECAVTQDTHEALAAYLCYAI